ncbi:hypothetical protein C5C56_00095 [Rathayibacter sp. AY1D1]|nr:hypothetical protein C5C56_00095 [Rathayibacter sp. AY1D1]
MDDRIAISASCLASSFKLLDLPDPARFLVRKMVEAVLQILDLTIHGYKSSQYLEEVRLHGVAERIERQPERIDINVVPRRRRPPRALRFSTHALIVTQDRAPAQ